MRIAILGSSKDTVLDHAELNEDQLNTLISDIARFLVDEGHEIMIVPDKGIPYDLAKEYKSMGGKKVWGILPSMDNRFGVKHLKEYMPILDERVFQDSWYAVNGEFAAANDACIVLGMAPGTLIEVCFLKYHYKFLSSETNLIWFKNTISTIPEELDSQLPVVWVESIKTMENILKKEDEDDTDEFLG